MAYDYNRLITNGWDFRELEPRNVLGECFRVFRRKDNAGPFLGRVLPPIPVGFETRMEAILFAHRRLAGITNPHLLPLHGCGTVYWSADRTKRAYVVGDWYDIDSLLVRRRDQAPLTPEACLPRMLHLLDALEALDQHGLRHGNIGPEAVQIGEDGAYRLFHPTEMQLVGEYSAAFTTGTTNWDFTFIAPEMYQDRSAGDIGSDLFALTAVAYHLLTRAKPFESTSLFSLGDDMLAQLRADDPIRHNAAIDDRVACVLACGLSIDRSRRYARPRQMAADIEYVLNGRTPPVATQLLGDGPRWAGDKVAAVALVSTPSSPASSAKPSPAADKVRRRTSDRRSPHARQSQGRTSIVKLPRPPTPPARPPGAAIVAVVIIVLVAVIIISVALPDGASRRRSPAPDDREGTATATVPPTPTPTPTRVRADPPLSRAASTPASSALAQRQAASPPVAQRDAMPPEEGIGATGEIRQQNMEQADTMSPPVGTVTRLVLIDADTGRDLMIMTDGATVDPEEVGTRRLSVRAEVDGAVHALRFSLDAKAEVRDARSAPVTLTRARDGACCAPWALSAGPHELTATPLLADASGEPLHLAFTLLAAELPSEQSPVGDGRVASVKAPGEEEPSAERSAVPAFDIAYLHELRQQLHDEPLLPTLAGVDGERLGVALAPVAEVAKTLPGLLMVHRTALRYTAMPMMAETAHFRDAHDGAIELELRGGSTMKFPLARLGYKQWLPLIKTVRQQDDRPGTRQQLALLGALLGDPPTADAPTIAKHLYAELRVGIHTVNESDPTEDREPAAEAPPAVSAPALDRGLIMHLPFDRLVRDEVVVAATGRAHDAVIDGPTLTRGVHGQALRFDGDDDVAVLHRPLTLPRVGSLALWLRADCESAGKRRIRIMGGDDACELVLHDGLHLYHDVFVDHLSPCFTPDPLQLATWHHTVLTWHADTPIRAIWLDGRCVARVEIGPDNRPPPLAEMTWSLGTRTGAEDAIPFAGALDDLRLYDRILEPDEIATLAAR